MDASGEGNEEIVSTILRWLGDECADKKHDGHDHEHLCKLASQLLEAPTSRKPPGIINSALGTSNPSGTLAAPLTASGANIKSPGPACVTFNKEATKPVTTDPKLAVSDGRLSSLNTAAASKQNIPYESTGRKRKRSALLAVLGPKQRSNTDPASQLQLPRLSQPQLQPSSQPSAHPQPPASASPLSQPQSQPQTYPMLQLPSLPIHNPHSTPKHTLMQIPNHIPKHSQPLSPNKSSSRKRVPLCQGLFDRRSRCSLISKPADAIL
ncbi:hypothetical protein WJX82_006368 [Trebouxia sp. C0006]